MSISRNEWGAEKQLRPFALALSLAGGVIGPSFSTGREIMTYFGTFGLPGLFGIVIAFSTLGALAYMSFSTARNMGKYSYEWQLSPKGWPPLRYFFKWFTVFGMFTAISAMISAAGSIVSLITGAPVLVGAIIMTAACLMSSSANIRSLTMVMSLTVPALLLLSAAVCVFCMISPMSETAGWAKVSSDNGLIGTWLSSSLIYCGYNSGAIRALMPSFARYFSKRSSCALAVIAFSTMLIISAATIMLVIVMNYSICGSSEMPVIAVAYARSPLLGTVYGIVALMAIYDTCAAALQIIRTSFTVMSQPVTGRRLKIIMLFICAGAFLMSFFGFSTFVDKVWALFGYASVPGIGISIYNFVYYWRHPVNVDAKTDTLSVEQR